jgi:hypothetical protein
MRLLRALGLSVGVLAATGGFVRAQASEHAAQKASPPPVGANDIFHALTQPDQPADIETLRNLRELLGKNPDRLALEQAREQLDAVLQKQEREQGSMPPALVMSSIASRIDAALTGLEEARHAPPPPPAPPPLMPKQPVWLVPALAAAAGTLAIALVASLIAMASQGTQAEDTDEIRDALAKIRRRLDDAAASAGKAQDISDTERDSAAAAVHEAAIAAGRLNGTIKEADAKLRATVEEADSRLNAAAGVAGQFEQWLEALPARLTETVATMEEAGLSRLDEAASQLASSTSVFAELALSLPATQQALQQAVAELGQSRDETVQALSALTVRAEQAGEALLAPNPAGAQSGSEQPLVAQGAEALEAGRVAMEAATARSIEAARIAASMSDMVAGQIGVVAREAKETVQAALTELSSSAELLTELSHLVFGQSIRLEDVLPRAVAAMEALPGIEQALSAAAARQPAQAQSGWGDIGTDETPDIAALQQTLEAAIETIQARGIAALDQAAARLDGSAAQAAELASRLPEAQAALTDAAATVSQAGTAQGAMWEQAVARIAVLAQAAPKVAEALAASSLALKADLSTAAEELAAGRAAVMQVTEAANSASAGLNAGATQLQAMLEATSSLPAQTAALVEAVQAVRRKPEAEEGGGPQTGELGDQAMVALASLQDMAERVQRVACRMELVLDEAASDRARAEADFRAGQAAQADGFGAVLEALAARADASLGGLPAEASALAAVSAELREDAAALSQAAERLAGGAASETIVLSAGMAQAIDTLNTACRRLEEHWARTGAAEASSGQEMASLRDETRRMLAELDGTQQTVAALAREAGSATQEAAAMLARAEHRLASAAAAAPLSNSDAHGVLALQTERLADLLDSGVHIAARLEAAAVQAVAQAADAAPSNADPSAPDRRLAGLEAAIDTVQAAAARLAQGAEAQEVALTRVTEAAAQVASLALVETAPAKAPYVSLSRLVSMATETEELQTVAESLAEAALRGEAVALTPELISQTPILLATIETSIHRLQGAATALALASDAKRKAA